jgi:ADP-heptose:LPS heptosyltransferase
MKIETKLALDRVLGIVIAYPLNVLVRLVGKITRYDHSLKNELSRIVICKFKGMGSIIQSTPLIQTLRTRYPKAQLIYVSAIENKTILDNISAIDEVICIDDRKFTSLLKTTIVSIHRLIRLRADLYIDLEIYSNFSSIFTTCSMARDRFGYYLRSNRYRMGMYTHMMYFNTKSPIAESYLQFARLLQIESISNELINLPKQAVEPVSRKPYIVINPNASDLRFERRWPANSFIELISYLCQTTSNDILLIGSPNEVDYVRSISSAFLNNHSVQDLSGKTSIPELIELLRNAELVITNDTGPMHLASALQTNVLALFGPCAPEQYGLGPTVKALYKNMYCSPCVHEFATPPCKGNNQCMQMISVNEVCAAITDYKRPTESSPIQFTDNERRALGTVIR